MGIVKKFASFLVGLLILLITVSTTALAHSTSSESYLAEVKRRLDRNYNPPTKDSPAPVTVSFEISRDGRLMNLNVKSSSVSPVVQQAALAAVRAAAPFRALPADFKGDKAPLEYTFNKVPSNQSLPKQVASVKQTPASTNYSKPKAQSQSELTMEKARKVPKPKRFANLGLSDVQWYRFLVLDSKYYKSTEQSREERGRQFARLGNSPEDKAKKQKLVDEAKQFMKDYNQYQLAILKDILTPHQFAKYKENQAQEQRELKQFLQKY